jgi:hypothetical protein
LKAERIGDEREGDFTDNFILLPQYSKFKFEHPFNLIYTDSIDTFVKFRNTDLIFLQQYFKCRTMVASRV